MLPLAAALIALDLPALGRPGGADRLGGDHRRDLPDPQSERPRWIAPLMARGVDGVRRAVRLRTAMTAWLLAAWTAMGLLFWVPGDILNHMFLVLVLACSLAGSSSMLAAHPASVAAALVFARRRAAGPADARGRSAGPDAGGTGPSALSALMGAQARVVYAWRSGRAIWSSSGSASSTRPRPRQARIPTATAPMPSRPAAPNPNSCPI